MAYEKYSPYNSFRAGQEKAIHDIISAFEHEKQVVELNAPTAAGKTVILYCVGRILEKEFGIGNIVFTSPQVSLIEQGNLFDLPKLVGKSNYSCEAIEGCTAAECPFSSKEEGFVSCDDCTYRMAKRKFHEAKFKATTLARYFVDRTINCDAQVIEIDEFTEAERALIDRTAIDLGMDKKIPNSRNWKEVDALLKATNTYLATDGARFDITKHIERRYDELRLMAQDLKVACSSYRKELFKSGNGKPDDKEIKKLKRMSSDYMHVNNQAMACGRALRYINSGVKYALVGEKEDVWNPNIGKKVPTIKTYFRLMDARLPFQDLIRDKEFVILASGTPTTSLLTNDYESVVMKHPIDKSRRLIHYTPVGKMNNNVKEKTAPLMAEKIKFLHDLYSRKTLVHCGSYAVAELLSEHLYHLHRNIILQDRTDREGSLLHWQRLDDAIFLSVRYEEGLSLDGPEYPMNVIAKAPFMNPYDAYVEQRNAYDNKKWYNLSLATLVQQACGRATRSPDDYSETYILDESFGWFYRSFNYLFADWFKEAFIWGR